MATATLTRSENKTKYPGWTIERTGTANYRMTRDSGVYAIGVSHSEAHGWEGVLMTRQHGSWAPARTPFTHCVAGCIAEADRREKQIAKYAAKPLSKLSR